MSYKTYNIFVIIVGLSLFGYTFYLSFIPIEIKKLNEEPISIPSKRNCVYKKSEIAYYTDKVYEIETTDCGYWWIPNERFIDLKNNSLNNLLIEGDTITIGYNSSNTDILPIALSINKGDLIILKPTHTHEITVYKEKEIHHKIIPFIYLGCCLLFIFFFKVEKKNILKRMPIAKEIQNINIETVINNQTKLHNFKFSKTNNIIIIDIYITPLEFRKVLEINLFEKTITKYCSFSKKRFQLSKVQSIIVYIRTADRETKVIATIFAYLGGNQLTELLTIQEKKDNLINIKNNYISVFNLSTKIAGLISYVINVKARLIDLKNI